MFKEKMNKLSRNEVFRCTTIFDCTAVGHFPNDWINYRVHCTAKAVDHTWFKMAALSVWPNMTEQPPQPGNG